MQVTDSDNTLAYDAVEFFTATKSVITPGPGYNAFLLWLSMRHSKGRKGGKGRGGGDKIPPLKTGKSKKILLNILKCRRDVRINVRLDAYD